MTPAPSRGKILASSETLQPRDFLIAISLANLWYFRVWQELIGYNSESLHSMKALPNKVVLAAVMLNVLLLAALFLAFTALFRRYASGRWSYAGRILFVVAWSVPLFGLYRVVSERYPILRGELVRKIGTVYAALIFVVIALALTVVAFRWNRWIARFAAAALLALSPAVLVTFGRAAYAMVKNDPHLLDDRPTAAMLPVGQQAPRLIWLLFDEWDYRISFVDRPTTLQLPEIDAFRKAAIFASNATPPARATLESVPMLLSGERYVNEEMNGVTRFEVTPTIDPTHSVPWRSRDLIFTDARSLGLNSGLAGWYLPYCRIINTLLNSCDWLPLENQRNSIRDDTVGQAMVDQTRSLFETSLFSPFGQSLITERHIYSYQRILGDAKSLVTDPRFGMVFVHFPVPHTPYIYNRRSQQFSGSNSAARGYYGNLALLDRTVGALRQEMQRAGVWDGATILLSTDHYFRSARLLDGKTDRRVPFLLKLPHQTQGVSFDQPFNTIVTKELLVHVLRGDIAQPPQVITWLTARSESNPARPSAR